MINNPSGIDFIVISVVIPTLNEGKYLGTTLRAIKAQRYGGKVEIIVSDSRSEDNTREIARKYGAKVVLSEKSGPAVGRNRGALIAKGDILVFLDADTIPSKDLFVCINDTLKKRKDVVGGTCKFLPYKGRFVDWLIYALSNGVARLMIRFGVPQDPGYCFFYRRKVFEKLGGIRGDLALNETHDLAIRSKRHGKFVYLNVPVFTSLRRYRKAGYLCTIWMYLKSTVTYFRTGSVSRIKFKFEPVR
ncbi:MAG TPA: glycosyltransferase [Hadesarchaea archaeon]|nr:glycosyltransferase [Hadesarchaea archaeon]